MKKGAFISKADRAKAYTRQKVMKKRYYVNEILQ